MGRLFWKFFLSILLAQVAATLGLGATFWLRDSSRQRNTEPTLDAGPPAAMMLDAAAATLKLAGVDGLRELAATSRRARLYVLDEKGKELLGRPVSAKLREEVNRSLTDPDTMQAVARLTGPDGRQYVVFASRTPRTLALGTALEVASTAGAAVGTRPHGMERERRGPGDRGPGSPPPGFSGQNDGPGGGPPGAAGPAPRGASGGPFAQGMANAAPNGAVPGYAPGRGPGSAPGAGPGPDSGHGPGGDARGGPGGWSGHRFWPWLPFVATTIASLVFAFLLAWYFSRPIRALRNAFEAAAAGDLAPKFADSKTGVAGDELAELGPDFDRMAAQLRSLMDGQRRLLHDVSHELRSPLARLQAAIGLAHQQPDRLQASLERIEREGVRMDRLVGELLTLSRLEAATAPPQTETLDLVEMVDQIADDARFEADAQVEVDAPLPLSVRAAPDLLWSAIENIVRNAVKHGGAGNLVQVRLRGEEGAVHIDVLDQGPGIAEEDLGKVFEPFFRSNPTKNNVDGHGLGLAIAKRVVDTHGGGITAANRPEGGLAVTITLPRAGA